jgi:hypothetical protein
MNASLLAALRTATDLARARKPEEATRIIRQALGGHRHMPLPEVPAVQPAPSLGRGLAETLRTLRARRHPPWQARPVVAVPDGAVFLSRTVSITAGTRDYRLYLPSNLTAAPRPLVVMLHGCTQTPEDFAVGTGMNALAERHGFLVAYPEQSREANQTGCWNWFASEHQCRWTGEPAIIAAIVAAIADEQAVDRTRVFVAGNPSRPLCRDLHPFRAAVRCSARHALGPRRHAWRAHEFAYTAAACPCHKGPATADRVPRRC